MVTDHDFLRVVAEDVQHLIDVWLPGEISLQNIRRDTVLLRRLIGSDHALSRAWSMVVGKTDFIVPTWRLEDIAASLPKAHTRLVSIGGAHYHDTIIGPGALTAYPERIPSPVVLKEHSLPLKVFERGKCFLIQGIEVSRVELIEYFANRLGGAHVGKRDSSAASATLDLVPRYTARREDIAEAMRNGGLPQLVSEVDHDGTTYRLDVLHGEILAIGQWLAKSPSSREFLQAMSAE